MCDWGLGLAEGFPWGLALPLFSFPCLSGGFFSFSSPTEGRGGNADREAWGKRDLAVLCPGSPAAQYRALGGLEKGHRLQVDADRALCRDKVPPRAGGLAPSWDSRLDGQGAHWVSFQLAPQPGAWEQSTPGGPTAHGILCSAHLFTCLHLSRPEV